MRKEQKSSAPALAGCTLLCVALTAATSFGQDPPRPTGGQAAAEQAAAASPANLAGRWELNTQASDPIKPPSSDPGEEGGGGGHSGGRGGGGGMGGRGGGMGGMGGGGGHSGGRGGGEGTRGGSRDSGPSQEEMRRLLDAQRVLVIVQHDASLSVTDDEGRVVTLKPDGVKVKEEQAGATIERTTKWDGRALVTQVKLSNGAHVTQTYTKVNEGLQLVLTTKIEGGRSPKPIEFKRVYDQALQ